MSSHRTPNVLFIFTDEQRFDTLAAYGNRKIEMPNLNRLAERSTVVERAYVSQPTCTPSRGTIMTGLYPHMTGVDRNNAMLPEDVPCLPELITSGKHRTMYGGKWHLGDEVFAQHGFEHWIATEDNYYNKNYRPHRDQGVRSAYYHFLRSHGYEPANGERFHRFESPCFPEEVSKPAFLAREVSQFIEKHQNEPFIAYVNFLEPHSPYYGPRDDQYDPDALPLPDNFDAPPDETNHLKSRLSAAEAKHTGVAFRSRSTEPDPLRTERDWRGLTANYWGLCSQVDTHAGHILNTLERCGLWDDTIIVFTSDHGEMLGSHRMVNKMVMYEESARVPLLIKVPHQRESRRIPQPISLVDLIPTMLDMLGESIPDHLPGRSRRSALEGDASLPTDDVFIEWNGPDCDYKKYIVKKDELPYPEHLSAIAPLDEAEAAAYDPIRTVITADGWKLNFSPRGEHELFNVYDDPEERRNRAFEPDQRQRFDELTDRIRAWQRRTGDTVDLTAAPMPGR